jgi:lambda family phage portal protein
MKLPFFNGRRNERAKPRAQRNFLPTLAQNIKNSVAGMFKSSYADAMDGWGSLPTSPDAFITLRQTALVARSREQWSNNDYVRAFVRLCRQNIVGSHGVIVQGKVMLANGKPDSNANAALEAAFKEWGEASNCDVTGESSWRELQALAVEHAARDGEFIFRKVYGPAAGKFGFALQAIDPIRLPVRYESGNFNDSGNFIRHGIEFTQYGKPIAYHFESLDEWDSYYYSVNGAGYVRVPADDIIHGFVKEMAGQRRGIPWAATSLFRLHHLQGFEDAAVQNARASASKMGFIQYTDKDLAPAGLDDEYEGGMSINAEPLSFHELPVGATIAEWTPNYPSGEFAIFHKAMLRGAAAGMGVGYWKLSNDQEGVNLSTARAADINERETWKDHQAWLIEKLCLPVYREFLKQALLRGLIVAKNGKPLSPAKIAVYQDVHFQGRRWSWMDPVKEATANIMEIQAGIKSPSAVIREQGKEPEDVYREIAEDMRMMADAGIPVNIVRKFFGLPLMPIDPNQLDDNEPSAE